MFDQGDYTTADMEYNTGNGDTLANGESVSFEAPACVCTGPGFGHDSGCAYDAFVSAR